MDIERRAEIQRRYLYILLFLVTSETLFFIYFGLTRHNNYLSSINDLGHFDQAIWGFLEGWPFLNTDNFNEPVSRLGGHFDPILALFVPFYFIIPSVNWLIIAQAIALTFTSFPIFYLALKVGQSVRTALIWATVYLISPFILSTAANDFHPVTLATPFIALAYLSLEEKNILKLFLCCIFILLCKEHFGLLVMGFGFLWYIKYREVSVSLSFILLGGVYFLLVMKVFIPAFSTFDEHSMIVGQTSRYDWLGHSLEDIIINIFRHPVDTARHVLLTMDGWQYLALLLLPLICLPLIGGEFLVPGLADLLANTLSSNPMPRSIFSYHSVTLVPVLIISAIYGARRVFPLFKQSMIRDPALIVLIPGLVLGWTFFPFVPLPGSYSFWAPQRIMNFHDENYDIIQRKIKPEMSLSVQANIGAHFTQRLEIYRYPNKVGDVDAVVLRLESPTLRMRDGDRYLIGSLGNHLQMNTSEYLNSVEQLLDSDIYQKRVWADPWLIFMKGEITTVGVNDIRHKIDSLKVLWE